LRGAEPPGLDRSALLPGWCGAVPLWRARAMLRRRRWRLFDRLFPPPAPAPLPLPRTPVRVAFVASEPAKWALDPLLQALRADPDFDCGLVLALSDVALRLPRAQRIAAHAQARAAFAARAPVWADLYHPASDRLHEPGVIAADLVFVQQPWGLQDLPRRLAGRMRVAYVHYGFQVIANDRMQFGLPDFHPFLWLHVVPTALHARAIAERPGPRPPRVAVAGHPRLDGWRAPPPDRAAVADWPRATETGRRRVVWAPHHSVGRAALGLATWDWSAPAMLDLSDRHPEIDVVLRPHPNLGFELARQGIMTPAAWQGWLARWAAAPNRAVSTGPGYLDLFRTSDALITDSGSFLAEYLPADRPLIRLERAGATGLNAVGRELSAGFYRTADRAGLEALFARVVVAGEDPLRPERQRLARLVLPDLPHGTASAAAGLVARLRAELGLPPRPADTG